VEGDRGEQVIANFWFVGVLWIWGLVRTATFCDVSSWNLCANVRN